jgi:membrane fusion protein, multidrug efflux system
MKAFLRPLFLFVLPLLLLGSACSKTDQSAPVEKPAIAVETAVATPATLLNTIPVTGTLTARRSAEVKTELAGQIREVYVSDWAPVRQGQPLARIQASESETSVKRGEAGVASARAAQLQAEVEADRSRREAERMAQLKAAGLATQQQLDDAGSAAAAASARVTAAQAQGQVSAEELAQLRLRLEKSLVRAPISGEVALCNVNVGDLAGADSGGSVIFRIVDNRLLDLTVTVPSQALAQVRVGQILEFSSDGCAGTFSGTVKYLNPSINPADRSLQLMAEIDNHDGRLRDGLFVKGQIVTGRRAGVLLVPRAVLAGLDLTAGKAFLFVVVGDKAERRAVQTGAISGEQVEIVAGLKAGERYVSRGAFNLRDGDKVSVAAVKQP